MTRVVKVGGSALVNAEWLAGFAAEAARAAAGGGLVVVHGGGPDVTELSRRLGLEVQWSGGRRVTTPEGLDVAVMVLSGKTNKRLVGSLVSAGADALGLSGEDGGLLLAVPVAGGALGRVGEIVRVRTELLEQLLALGHLPVISPISRGMDGVALNVNADDAATAVAVALRASELLFLTDVPGVLRAGERIPVLGAEAAASLVADGIATGGMSVKLQAAVAAIRAGVHTVRVGPMEMLTDAGAGTSISSDAEVTA